MCPYLIIRKKKEGLDTAHKIAFEYALKNNYEYLITLDADLSHDPKIIPKLTPETSWAALGPQEPPPLFPLTAFSTIFGRPGGVRRTSGEPLGSLWALLARLLVFPGVLFRVSGPVAATIEQEA